jgi:hypothetical protein
LQYFRDMTQIRLLGFALGIASVFFFSASSAHGDAAGNATLSDIHKTLLQAAGYNSDTPPTQDQQVQLLNEALEQLHDVPHVYHGQLKEAARLINAALSELSNGDPAHKAREDIFGADDQIKSIM